MNRFMKALIATLGGINVVFSIFVPIAVSLLVIKSWDLSGFGSFLIMLIAILSSIYRAIKIGWMK